MMHNEVVCEKYFTVNGPEASEISDRETSGEDSEEDELGLA